MSNVLKLFVWASGLIEFLGEEEEPDGAILVCVARGDDAIEMLLLSVGGASILYDFGDQVGLRVPDIDPNRPDAGEGLDDAVDRLIEWEEYLREDLYDGCDPATLDIRWARS